jgi:hypothetical protein
MNNKEIPFLPTKTAHLILFVILAIVTVLVAVIIASLMLFAAFVGPAMMHVA